jgi:cell division protein FtsB
MKGGCMASVKQIQFRLRNAKKTLTKLNKNLTATKGRIKKLQGELTKAKAAEKAEKPKKKKAAPQKRGSTKKRPAARKRTAKKKA